MKRVLGALVTGLALMALALVVVLSRSPATLAGTNGVIAHEAIATAAGNSRICQGAGSLPSRTSAIRVSLSANVGPRITVVARAGTHIVARGERPPGWGLAETVTVPVQPLPRAVKNITICTELGPAVESVEINGTPVAEAKQVSAIANPVDLRIEYLRHGPSSWWALAPSIARNLGFGHAPKGAGSAWLVVAGMLAAAALACRLLTRELR